MVGRAGVVKRTRIVATAIVVAFGAGMAPAEAANWTPLLELLEALGLRGKGYVDDFVETVPDVVPKQPWPRVGPPTSKPLVDVLRDLEPPPPGRLASIYPPPAPLGRKEGIWTPRPQQPWLGLSGCAVYAGRGDLTSGLDAIVWTGTANSNGTTTWFEVALQTMNEIKDLHASYGAQRLAELIEATQEQIEEDVSRQTGGRATFEQWAILTSIYMYEHGSDFDECRKGLTGML
jgi:hypothetical protein